MDNSGILVDMKQNFRKRCSYEDHNLGVRFKRGYMSLKGKKVSKATKPCYHSEIKI